MTDSDAGLASGTYQLEAGDEVGECGSCGVVVADSLTSGFPEPPECPVCESPMKKVIKLTEDAEVTPDVVA